MSDLSYRQEELMSLIIYEIPINSFMIHYTGVEVVEKLLRTGNLPSDKPFASYDNDSERLRDKIFFTPCDFTGLEDDEVFSKLWHLPIYDSWFDFCLAIARLPSINGTISLFRSETGIYDIDLSDQSTLDCLSDIDENSVYGGENKDIIDELFEKHNVEDIDPKHFFEKLQISKGVAIIVNRDVLELGYSGAFDDEVGSVEIYCPGGLDKRFIQWIVPLGKREKEILNGYLED